LKFLLKSDCIKIIFLLYFIKFNEFIIIFTKLLGLNLKKNIFGDWGLGIGDWGLGIGDWANPQSPIPNPPNPKPPD